MDGKDVDWQNDQQATDECGLGKFRERFHKMSLLRDTTFLSSGG
jgi:hypothetical protein